MPRISPNSAGPSGELVAASRCATRSRQRRGPHQMPEQAIAEAGYGPGPSRSRGAGPRRGLIGQMRRRIQTQPGSWLRPRLSRPNRSLPSPVTTQLDDTVPERQIQAESPIEKPGSPQRHRADEERRRAGRWHPAPATKQDQTKLYGLVVYSWSDKVLSVQRIRTRTRTR